MRMWMMTALSIGALTLSAGAALADNALDLSFKLSQARTAFIAGDYVNAESALEPLSTSAALTLRAESMSARVMLGLTDEPHDLAGKARKIAEQALRLDPSNTEARIQYALAYGFEARSAGIFKAWRKKLPEKCKVAIDQAYAAAPDDARTSALIGAWHLGLVHKAGDRRAETMFGATLADGIKYYDAAIAMAPDDIIILGNYAISLLGIDASAHKDKAKILILALQSAKPRDATDAEVQRRMVNLLPALDGTNPDALLHAVEAWMNDPVEDRAKYEKYDRE